MAGALPIPHSFPSLRIHPHRPPPLSLPPRASSDPGDSSGDPSGDPSGESAAFERRLSQVRLKYRSGTGRKAEQRRAKKSGSSSSSGAGAKKGVFLPPAPLREAVSAGGVPVEVGFSRYSERLNGRFAALGLAALLLVELGSGRSLLAYHPPPVLFLQLYSLAAAAALFVKFEKERISIWPQNKPSSSSSSSSAAANSEP